MVHLLAGRAASAPSTVAAVAAAAAVSSAVTAATAPTSRRHTGAHIGSSGSHRGRTCSVLPFLTTQCVQRRAASSSSSSSSPSATMLKFQSSASQAKGKGPASATERAEDGESGAGQSGDAEPQQRKRSSRARASVPSDMVADEALLAGDSGDEPNGSALGTGTSGHVGSREHPELATSPGPPPPGHAAVAAAATGASTSWAEIANPRMLVAHLDSYVIGQTRAKKALSVAVFNHYVRLQANSQAKIDQEERTMAQQWAAGRNKERDLSKKLQHSVEEAERSRLASSRSNPRINARTESSERWSHDATLASPMKSINRAPDRTKSPRRSKSADSHAASIEESSSGRGTDHILTDFVGQIEGETSAAPDRDFGYFSSNEPKGNARSASSRRKDARAASLDADERAPQNQDERVRRAIRVANARLDGRKVELDLAPERSEREASPSEQSGASSSVQHQPIPVATALPVPSTALAPFEKANVLLLGPTGSGKSLLLRTLASALHVPFVHVDATPLTQAGYVGEDVDSIVQRLLVASGYDSERAAHGIVCIDEVDKLAARRGTDGTGGGRDVGGEGVQQALLRLLEGSVVTITDKGGQGAAAAATTTGSASAQQAPRSSLAVEPDQVPPWWPGAARSVTTQGPRSNTNEDAKSWTTSTTPTGRSATNSGLPGFSAGGRSSSVAQPQNGIYHVDTSSVLFVLCGAFVGLEKIVRARLIREGAWPQDPHPRPDQSISYEDRERLLKHVEDVDLQAFGLIPEFVGRVPVIAALSPLSEADLVRVLTEPRNSLLSQYESLFASSDVSLRVTKPALRAIAAQAATKSTGARGLRRIMEDRLLEAMYLAPGSSVKYGLVDEQAALGNAEVQLYSRGGKMAWLAAAADDEAGDGHAMGPFRSGHKPAAALADGSDKAGNVDVSPVHSVLRRKARTRLVRPSRLGHFRLRL
ncbi:ATP-binding protein [Tilletia horrida]|nr:ATP-binding protein [Tilletia horrida]